MSDTNERRARAERLAGTIERRAVNVHDFEMRAQGDARIFTGYAALFNAPYEMYGGPAKGGWVETVNTKAFDRTLRAGPDVSLNVDHGMSLSGLPIARTTAPGPIAKLSLATDKKGLKPEARLDPTMDDDVRQLQQKMDLGLVTQMSFAFRTIRQVWNEDYTERELLELDLNKGDVSVVTNGANDQTSSQMRDIEEALELLARADLAEVRGADARAIEAARAALATRDADDDPAEIAQAIDAVLDAVEAALDANNIDQAKALVEAAGLSVDALLALLGVADASDMMSANRQSRQLTVVRTEHDGRRGSVALADELITNELLARRA